MKVSIRELIKISILSAAVGLAACSGDYKATGGAGCDHCGQQDPAIPVEPTDPEAPEEMTLFEEACLALGGSVREAMEEEIEEGLDADGEVCSDGNGGIYTVEIVDL